jgi:hypothetical protein
MHHVPQLVTALFPMRFQLKLKLKDHGRQLDIIVESAHGPSRNTKLR